MTDHPKDLIQSAQSEDNIDRRGFLKCMAWAGTGLVWSINGGVLSSALLGSAHAATEGAQRLVKIDSLAPFWCRKLLYRNVRETSEH